MKIRPVELAETRTKIVRQRDLVGAKAIAGLHMDKAFADAMGLTSEEVVDRETSKLALADLFYVSEDMTRLALEASRTLPLFNANADDFPSEIGLVFFDGGVSALWGKHPVQIHAVSWQTFLIGAQFAVYIDVESALSITRQDREEALRELRAIGAYESDLWFNDVVRGLMGFHPDAAKDEQQELDQKAGSPVGTTAYMLLRSALLMMQQPFASISEAEYGRTDRRRLTRRDVPLDKVRVITLRRSSSHSSEPGESDREYHHQWIVRGHWRQQYYPSRGVHRPVWIAPHIKGPEGAPLLGGEKVHAWTR